MHKHGHTHTHTELGFPTGVMGFRSIVQGFEEDGEWFSPERHSKYDTRALL